MGLTKVEAGAPLTIESIAVYTAIAGAGPTFVTEGSDTIAIDFSGDSIRTRTATGAVTFTGSNYTEGKSTTVRIVAGASSRDLTFPASWVFISYKPTSLPDSETGILTVTSFGTAEADCVAAWAETL
jgi:hypothetical protein